MSLAHRGVLILDELLQFRPDALDALRQPLEAGEVTISRVDGPCASRRLPARFVLLTAFSPCPCGWLGSRARACVCDPVVIHRYVRRLSGPFRDRIDLWVAVEEPRHLLVEGPGEPSAVVAERIRDAWSRQRHRQDTANAELQPAALDARHGFARPAITAVIRLARALRLAPRRVHRDRGRCSQDSGPVNESSSSD